MAGVMSQMLHLCMAGVKEPKPVDQLIELPQVSFPRKGPKSKWNKLCNKFIQICLLIHLTNVIDSQVVVTA